MRRIALTFFVLFTLASRWSPSFPDPVNTWSSEDFDISVAWSNSWTVTTSFSASNRAFIVYTSDSAEVSLTVVRTHGKSVAELIEQYLGVEDGDSSLQAAEGDEFYPWLSGRFLFENHTSDIYATLTFEIRGEVLDGIPEISGLAELREIQIDKSSDRVIIIRVSSFDSDGLNSVGFDDIPLADIEITDLEGNAIPIVLPVGLSPTASFSWITAPLSPTEIPTQSPSPSPSPTPTPVPTIVPRPTQTPLPTVPPIDCSGYSEWRQKTADRVQQLDEIFANLSDGLRLPGLFRLGSVTAAQSSLETLSDEIFNDEPPTIAADVEPYSSKR